MTYFSSDFALIPRVVNPHSVDHFGPTFVPFYNSVLFCFRRPLENDGRARLSEKLRSFAVKHRFCFCSPTTRRDMNCQLVLCVTDAVSC